MYFPCKNAVLFFVGKESQASHGLQPSSTSESGRTVAWSWLIGVSQTMSIILSTKKEVCRGEIEGCPAGSLLFQPLILLLVLRVVFLDSLHIFWAEYIFALTLVLFSYFIKFHCVSTHESPLVVPLL